MARPYCDQSTEILDCSGILVCRDIEDQLFKIQSVASRTSLAEAAGVSAST